MRSVNSVTLIGNAGRDPETRTLPSGMVASNFSLATSYKRGEEERTDWHRITAFGKLAEIVDDYVKKGAPLYINGRISYGSYEKDGVTISTTEIIANEIVLLGKKSDNESF
jgi:single-strand DNA-binding protein